MVRYISLPQNQLIMGKTNTAKRLNSHASVKSRCITLTIARVRPQPQQGWPVMCHQIQTGIPEPLIHSTGRRIIATGMIMSTTRCNLGEDRKPLILSIVYPFLCVTRLVLGRPIYSLTILLSLSVKLPEMIMIRSIRVQMPQPPQVRSCATPVPILPT